MLLQVNDPKARAWYMAEAAAQTWSTRTLQRNIDSQYYYRLLQSQQKDLVEKEMLEITAPSQVPDRLEQPEVKVTKTASCTTNRDFSRFVMWEM